MVRQSGFTVVVGSASSDVSGEDAAAPRSTFGIASLDDLHAVMPALVEASAGVVVVHDESLLDPVVGELRRVGRVAIRRASPTGSTGGPALEHDGAALLDLLAKGLSLGDAAARLHLSRRTADRRLAEAKRALGATTTPQAVAAFLRLRRASDDHKEVPVLGRDREIHLAVAALASDRAVLVVGEGGVGKSALLDEVARRDGRVTRAASALATMQWREYWPLSRAVGVRDLAGDAEAVATAIEQAAGPELLIVDDVHLADDATLEVLAALVGRVAMICASRPDDGAHRRVIERLSDAGAEVLPLAPLSDDDARQLLEVLAPWLSAERAQAVVAGAGGLPLLIEFLSGVDEEAPVGRGLVPAVAALGDGELATATLLALSGSALACDGEPLVRAGFAVAGEDGRFRIRHQLIADAVLARASAELIASSHAALAVAAPTPAEAAQHWLAAGEAGRARAEAEAAAAQAVSLSDRARMLALAARCAEGADAVREGMLAAQTLSSAGLHDEALALVDQLALPESDDQVHALADLIRARALWHRADAGGAVRCAQRGAARVSGTGTAVEGHLLIESVRCEVLSTGIADDHDERLARAGRIVGDGPGRAALLNVAAILPYFRTGEGIAEWQEGHAAALVEGDTDTLMRCANNIIMWNEASGDQGAALDMAVTMAREAGERGLGSWELQFSAAAANLLYHQGRFSEAMPLLERVLAQSRDVRTREQAEIVHRSILIDLGLLEAARAGLPPLPGDGQRDWLHDNSLFCVHAALELAAGRPQHVVRIARAFDERSPTDSSTWVFLLPLLAWAQHDLGVPVDERQEDSPIPLVQGLIREAEGVALMASSPERAREILDEAADIGLGWSRSAGLRAQWGAAEAARLGGSPDAVDRLLAVEQEVAARGMEPLLARVHRSLRLAGVKRAARRGTDRSGLLTSRERLVLDLLGEGATYAEVARRLGVGRPAVRRLSESAQLKLGVGSRTAAVAAHAGA